MPTNANSSSCRSHSLLYANEMKKFTPWAVQMWDASGKLPVGILHGNFYHLGNFEECTQVAEISPFEVQQCLVQFGNIISQPRKPVDWLPEEVETITGGIPILKERLTIAICLPSSCSLHDLQQHYENIASRFNFTLHLDNYSCTKSDRKKEFTSLDIVSLFIVLGLISFIILATVIEVYFLHHFKRGFPREITLSFSAAQNSASLLKTSDSCFASIDGIRLLSCLWIMIGHHCYLNILTPAINYSSRMQHFTKWYATPLLDTGLAVHNFVIINGALQMYLFLKKINSGEKFNFSSYYLHRIIRIMPAYIMQILMGMTIFTHVSTGPMWRYFIERNRDICYKNWWTNLLFINNYVHPDLQCYPTSWYLSMDMQLYILLPLILTPLYKWKKSPKYLISTLVVVGNIISFSVYFFNELSGSTIVSTDYYESARKYTGAYVTTHTRLSQWGVGIGLGYILFRNNGEKVKISKNVVSFCWFLCIVCAAFIFQFITYFHQDGAPPNRFISAAYASLGSTVWGLCVCWVIFATENGYGGAFGRFLSWKVFQPLSKLTYVLYLFHLIIQFTFLASIKTVAYMEIPSMVREIFGEILILILLSPAICMIFEMPFVNLERAIQKLYFEIKKNGSAGSNTELNGPTKRISNTENHSNIKND